MTQAAGEPFLIFADDVAWWDEPPEPSPPEPLPAPRRRPRRQARTLAGDLACLRAALEHSAPRPLALLAAVVALVVAARIALTGEERPPAAAPPARSAASQEPPPSHAPPPVLRTLGPGDRGAAVRDLQGALAALGLYRLGADGSFGEDTGAAVAELQGKRGLVVDGVAGPATLSSILEVVAERAAADADAVERGLRDAVRAGRLPRETASRYAAIVADSLAAVRGLLPGRGATLGAVLHDIAAQATSYDRPRALALFAMLATNRDYLADNPVPAGPLDIEGSDGVVYRYFAGHGLQFHPLANFARLNVLARKEEREAARRLADALVARGVPSGDTVTWEYHFPFQGPPRWTSGLAQAAGAQALARS
ncbi:MAG: peptidoglycan-binding domain-containing protein, partial [Gaiellaceae bacterium]